MAECLFIKADEVVKMLGVSQSEAYRIIKKLNEEIAEYQADKSIEEMADVLMYFNDVLLCYDITPEEFAAVYRKKHDTNMSRW